MPRIYIITDRTGAPLALADAVSQAEGLRLYSEHAGIAARPATSREALELRELPVLKRASEQAEVGAIGITNEEG